MIDPNTDTPALDEEDAYVQALERAKAPPEPEPPADPEHPEPAPEAGSSSPEPEKVAEPAKFDPASLPPDVRAEFDRLAQERDRERSEKLSLLGRVPRLQSELDRLQSQSRQQPPAPPAIPASTSSDDSKPYFDSADWKEFERDFPHEAKAQRKALEAAFAQADEAKRAAADALRGVETRVAPVEEFIRLQAIERETHALEQAHPDWREVVRPANENDAVNISADPKTPYWTNSQFASWFSVQDPDIQRWAFQTTAEKNIRLLDAYKRDLYLAEQHEAAPAAPAANATRRTPDIDPTPRLRQTNPVSRATSGDPEEEAYAAYLERRAAASR